MSECLIIQFVCIVFKVNPWLKEFVFCQICRFRSKNFNEISRWAIFRKGTSSSFKVPANLRCHTYASIKHNISTWNWATCPQRPSFMSSFKDHCKPPIGKGPNLNNHLFKPSLNVMKITSEFVDTFIARCTVAALAAESQLPASGCLLNFNKAQL